MLNDLPDKNQPKLQFTTTGDLVRCFRNAGMKNVNYQTIARWEKNGFLKFKRFPISNHRAVPIDKLNEIVESFFPGGPGKWEDQ